ncbi:hypothetical protein acsn021_01370 [Anaerocolumna cellulosilytica]|uniref:Uncharacterized protein n=1 Tax=Anaerocolumna cellulosilytica TaxID=433286 RepID=A0A6S6R0Q3_9FIRM|nr:hypothetical protein [Anaerocolumna cellulosilytica]MBB5196112.1 hypothetical protein [Anaerocolumna cellulosilytica]BCJ92568.1 hypothetical protein acsn021_01370 [Anaerocolumna cellulosilytica]
MDKKELQNIAQVLLAYEESKDTSKCKTIKDREAELLKYPVTHDSEALLAQPYHIMMDTEYRRKAGYFKIVQLFKKSGCLPDGHTLLTLALTIEEMSRMIYESFWELKDLFRSLLKEYEKNQKEPDILGALAILKACRLSLVLPEHYMAIGLRYMGDEEETFGFTPSLTKGLRKACKKEYNTLCELWGGLL